MKHSFRVIDAFADRPFTGNPAAVVLLENWPDDGWLQNVAMEMNHAETAFLVPEPKGYQLRWFTPKVEVDLCGHATLASAASLVEDGLLVDDQCVEFSTRSGPLRVAYRNGEYQLDFPVVIAEACEPPAGLLESLDVPVVQVLRNRFDYLVQLSSAELVRHIQPNLNELAKIQCRGLIVTAADESGQFDFVSRFFAPAAGVDEDPVTGSAHCSLADFWRHKLGKQTMVGYQASQRGGVVGVEVVGERVLLTGKACVFSSGQFVG